MTGMTQETAPLLDIADLEVVFRHRGAQIRAVDRVSLSIQPGEVLGLVGESGSGKSTIGRAVLGLTDVHAGHITFDGQDITRLRGRRRQGLAADLQVVFQDPLSSLDPRWSIGRSLAEPLTLRRHLGPGEAAMEIANLLATVGLPADAAARMPRQLSGGQRQRVAIARAVSLSPRLVICDEPTSALDLSTQAQTLNLLRSTQHSRSLSYLFISHDLDVVRYISDRITVLYRGQIMESGPAVDVADKPEHPYTRALTSSALVPDPIAQAARRRIRQQITRHTTAEAGLPAAAGCPFAPRCSFEADVCRDTRPALINITQGRKVACHMFDPRANHPRVAAEFRS